MITKFISKNDEDSAIEFYNYKGSLFIDSHYTDEDIRTTVLSEKDLFSLIGQLLRLQSELKKEVSND